VLAGEVEGLRLDPELRWSLWQALTATGAAGTEELDAELAREDTATTRLAHRAALAGRPGPEVKARAWSALGLPAPGEDAELGESELSNDEVDAVIAGFTQPLHAPLLDAYVEPYFALLPQLWAGRSIEIAERLVAGLYPAWVDAEDAAGDHPVVARTRRWLAEHAAPGTGTSRTAARGSPDSPRAGRAAAPWRGAGRSGRRGRRPRAR
jgi:aminopeptidase N